MRTTSVALVFLLVSASPAVNADIAVDDLPGDTAWYFHADLDGIRSSDAGGKLYEWLDDEVIVEINDEVGIDLGKEVNSVTAFANGDSGTVIVVDGPLSKDTRDKLLAMAADKGPLDLREHKGRDYYYFGNEDEQDRSNSEPFDDLDDSAYVSFDVKGKAIMTGKEGQMHALLDGGGKLTGMDNHGSALLLLSANKSLVQAGMNTDGIVDEDEDGWESNIVRNTEQAALLVADESGMFAIEAQLVSTDPKMAQAIGGIVNGLMGLQAFNSELGPEFQEVIRNTKIDVNENILSISTVLNPDVVISILEE